MRDYYILIIDDDEDIRNLIKASLEVYLRLPLGIDVATSAEEALRYSKDKSYNLIITDYKLPGLSGVEFVDKLRKFKRHLSTPIVFISGFMKELISETNAKKFDNVAFLDKPFEIDKLLSHVEMICLNSVA